MANFTVHATDHRPGAYGDAHSGTVATIAEAHALAHELNCGIYSIVTGGRSYVYEWDGRNAPVLIESETGTTTTYPLATSGQHDIDWMTVPEVIHNGDLSTIVAPSHERGYCWFCDERFTR